MNPGLLILLAIGAYFLLGGGTSSGAAAGAFQGGYVDLITQALITSAKCGQQISFAVVGQTSVWLESTQNGQHQYSGPFVVPMNPYRLLCPQDVGTFQASIYSLNADGSKGTLLGQASLTVTAS